MRLCLVWQCRGLDVAINASASKSSVCAFADRWQNATFCTHFNQSTQSYICHFNNTIRLDFSIWGWFWCAENGWNVPLNSIWMSIQMENVSHRNIIRFEFHTHSYTLHLKSIWIFAHRRREQESKRVEKYLHDKGTQSTQAACEILWMPMWKYWIFKWTIRTAKAYIEK